MRKVQIAEACRGMAEAIEWLQSLIGPIPQGNRIFEHQKVLDTEMEFFRHHGSKSLPHDTMETHLILESQLEATIWASICGKFKGRTDTAFLIKLKESLFGPVLSFDERPEKGRALGSFGRDIQSELLFASTFGDSSIVTFEGADIVLALGSARVGFECKRVHSKRNIIRAFNEAARQIQENKNIDFGLVAFRIDKQIYVPRTDGRQIGLSMVSRGANYLRGATIEEAFRVAEFQTDCFHKEFDKQFRDQARALGRTKVSGNCPFVVLPAIVGSPSVVACVGQTIFGLWEDSDKKRKDTLTALRSHIDQNPFK